MIILGVIHLKGLPGSPSNKLNLEEITELAQNDIDNLSKAGVNGIIVENFGDVPFVKNDVSKRTVASLTSVIQNLNIDSKSPLDCSCYLDSSLFSSLLCSPDRMSVIIKYITVSTRYVSANLNVLPE